MNECAAVLRVSNKEVLVGGTMHEGWLPAGAGKSLKDPVRTVCFSFEIQPEGGGYLLCSVSQDGELFSDSWYETLEGAKRVALEDFGVQVHDWKEA